MYKWEVVALTPAVVLSFQGCAWLPEQLAKAGEKIAYADKLADAKLAFNLEPLRCEIGHTENLNCSTEKLNRAPEYPPPAQSFIAAVDVRAIVGGRGEGLSCSIPSPLASLFFPPPSTPSGIMRASPIGLHFRQACVLHDYCYRHGLATYGYRQPDCDALLYDNAFRACSAIYIDRNKSASTDTTISYCRREAALVFFGVTKFGGKAFRSEGESTFFEFDSQARATRTYRENDSKDGSHLGFSVARILRNPETHDITPTIFDIEGSKWKARQNATGKSISIVEQSTGKNTNKKSFASMPPPVFPALGEARKATSLFVVRRNELRNTGMELFAFHELNAQLIEALGASKETHFDCDTPTNLLVQYSDKLAIQGSGIASVKAGLGRCRDPLKLPNTSIAVQTIPFNDRLVQTSGYRLTQHVPLFGTFIKGEGETAFLARGHYEVPGEPNESLKAKTRLGDDYRHQAMVHVISNDGKPIGRADTDIAETDEPVVAIRVAAWSTVVRVSDGMLSIRATTDDRICMKIWNPSAPVARNTPCVPIEARQGSPEIDRSWLAMPPQIVRLANDEEVLLFSRVCIDLGADCAARNDHVWKQIGAGSALPQQLLLQAFVLRINEVRLISNSTIAYAVHRPSASLVATRPIHLTEYVNTIRSLDEANASFKAMLFLRRARSCGAPNLKPDDQACQNVLRDAALQWRYSQNLASISAAHPSKIQAHFAPHPFGIDAWQTLEVELPK